VVEPFVNRMVPLSSLTDLSTKKTKFLVCVEFGKGQLIQFKWEAAGNDVWKVKAGLDCLQSAVGITNPSKFNDSLKVVSAAVNSWLLCRDRPRTSMVRGSAALLTWFGMRAQTK
jgi:hypothetical protein